VGALGTLALQGPVFAQATYKRKSIDALTDEELANYKHAIQITIDRSRTDPSRKDGYRWQADLHNDDVRVRPDGSIGRCDHGSERFLPWHRSHLVGFERILRASDPPRTANVVIPYWDWTKPPSGRRLPKALEDRSSPLFNVGRDDRGRPVIWPDLPIDTMDIATIVKERDWGVFAGLPLGQASTPPLERMPHNRLHGRIGSTMGSPDTASEDPIYWSFHCYIDLIWSRWQRLHTSATSPQPFGDGTPTIWTEPLTPKISDMATTVGLGYEYDYDFEAADGPVTVLVAGGGQTESIGLPIQSETANSITASPAASPQAESRKFVRIRDVVRRGDTSYDLNVYVHPTTVDIDRASDSERNKYLVESMTIWRGSTHHAMTSDVFVDVTKAVKDLGGANWAVTIRPNAVPVSGAALESTAPNIGSGRALFKSLELQERK
jgi:tyrosinase